MAATPLTTAEKETQLYNDTNMDGSTTQAVDQRQVDKEIDLGMSMNPAID